MRETGDWIQILKMISDRTKNRQGDNMLKEKDVEIYFRSKIDASYESELERLFFFNHNQQKYIDRINRSLVEYSKPVLKNCGDKVALVFEDEMIGQTLHLFDSNGHEAELIGVVMYARDSIDRVTIVHLVLHERCGVIYKKSHVNIASIVLQELISTFRKMKGVEKVRLYYTDTEISISQKAEHQPVQAGES